MTNRHKCCYTFEFWPVHRPRNACFRQSIGTVMVSVHVFTLVYQIIYRTRIKETIASKVRTRARETFASLTHNQTIQNGIEMREAYTNAVKITQTK